MAFQRNDFVEIKYDAYDTDSGRLVDTTNEKKAKDMKIYQEGVKYGGIVVCLGFRDVIKGLDDFIIGKEPGEYKLELKPEDAFGKKDPNLIKLMPMNAFIEANIKPFPGLQLNLDGILCTVRSVSGGRVLVDFNHPLSGKTIKYELKINKKITDLREKIDSLLDLRLEKYNIVKLENGILEVKCKIRKEFEKPLEKEIKDKIKEIEKIVFLEEEKKENLKEKTETK